MRPELLKKKDAPPRTYTGWYTWRIIRAEDRASGDEQLLDEYRNVVAEEYSLTREQLDKIADEGLLKSWPFPEIQ